MGRHTVTVSAILTWLVSCCIAADVRIEPPSFHDFARVYSYGSTVNLSWSTPDVAEVSIRLRSVASAEYGVVVANLHDSSFLWVVGQGQNLSSSDASSTGYILRLGAANGSDIQEQNWDNGVLWSSYFNITNLPHETTPESSSNSPASVQTVSKQLSGGAIAGIVIGSLVGVSVIVAALFMFNWYSRKRGVKGDQLKTHELTDEQPRRCEVAGEKPTGSEVTELDAPRQIQGSKSTVIPRVELDSQPALYELSGSTSHSHAVPV